MKMLRMICAADGMELHVNFPRSQLRADARLKMRLEAQLPYVQVAPGGIFLEIEPGMAVFSARSRPPSRTEEQVGQSGPRFDLPAGEGEGRFIIDRAALEAIYPLRPVTGP